MLRTFANIPGWIILIWGGIAVWSLYSYFSLKTERDFRISKETYLLREFVRDNKFQCPNCTSSAHWVDYIRNDEAALVCSGCGYEISLPVLDSNTHIEVEYPICSQCDIEITKIEGKDLLCPKCNRKDITSVVPG